MVFKKLSILDGVGLLLDWSNPDKSESDFKSFFISSHGKSVNTCTPISSIARPRAAGGYPARWVDYSVPQSFRGKHVRRKSIPPGDFAKKQTASPSGTDFRYTCQPSERSLL
jgi:hypothetical protein